MSGARARILVAFLFAGFFSIVGIAGAEQPLNDVQLLITRRERILFYYQKKIAAAQKGETRFFMDDELLVVDVTEDGVPEIMFRSGNWGASDYVSVEHIVRYDPAVDTFVDIAPAEFFDSGTHGLRWLFLPGKPVLIIAKRGEWPVSTPPDERCHYCDSSFVFDAYQWKPENGTRCPLLSCDVVAGISDGECCRLTEKAVV